MVEQQTPIGSEQVVSSQEGTQQAQAPTMFGNVAAADLESALNTITPGLSLEDVRSVGSLRQQLAEAQQRSQQAYSHPLVQQLNDLMANGGDVTSFIPIIELQSVDARNISDEEAIQLHTRYGKNTTKEIAQMLFQRKYAPLPENASDDDKALRAYDLAQDAQEARRFIEERKQTVAPTQTPEKLAQSMRLKEGWNAVVTQLPKTFDVVSQRDGKDYYKLEGFNPKLTPEQERQVMEATVQYAVSQSLPLDGVGSAKVKDYRDTFVRTIAHDQLVDAILRDVEASLTKNTALRYNNPSPIGGTQSSQPNTKANQQSGQQRRQGFA